MSTIEEMKAVELTAEELQATNGGAYRPLPPMEGYYVYRIVRGDTLIRIARDFNTTVAKIMAANPKIHNASKIYADDYIYIPMM